MRALTALWELLYLSNLLPGTGESKEDFAPAWKRLLLGQ